jgi:hypothetical protein
MRALELWSTRTARQRHDSAGAVIEVTDSIAMR